LRMMVMDNHSPPIFVKNTAIFFFFFFYLFGFINPERSRNHCSNSKATIAIPNPKMWVSLNTALLLFNYFQ